MKKNEENNKNLEICANCKFYKDGMCRKMHDRVNPDDMAVCFKPVK